MLRGFVPMSRGDEPASRDDALRLRELGSTSWVGAAKSPGHLEPMPGDDEAASWDDAAMPLALERMLRGNELLSRGDASMPRDFGSMSRGDVTMPRGFGSMSRGNASMLRRFEAVSRADEPMSRSDVFLHRELEPVPRDNRLTLRDDASMLWRLGEVFRDDEAVPWDVEATPRVNRPVLRSAEAPLARAGT